MEKNVREILYDALGDLTEEEFKDFKWKLRDCHSKGQGTIPWGELEVADRKTAVDLLYGCYSDDDAACSSVCLEVLGRINARSVAEKVQREVPSEKDVASQPRKARPASETDYRLEYMNYIKETFQIMKDRNSLLGEFVLLKEQYSKLIILGHRRPENEKNYVIITSRWQHDQIMKKRYRCFINIQMLFQPDKSGHIPDVVVLQGAAGIGKTMTARKIMLDWASGKLYQDLFDYVFYIHCRGMNFGTEEKSMADMILTHGAKKYAIKGMLKNPQKLLFIIDGFDELRFSIDQPEDCLCSHPWKKASTSVLISSLLKKKLLPESRLIITTRPTALEKLSLLLGKSRYAEILGFSPKDRREYFLSFFQNKDQAEKALRVVQQNETLFTMCFVPIVCWIICAVMKQQLDRGEDVVQTSNTITAIYMLYLSSLFKPSNSHGKELMQTSLRSLCSLAVDGIWEQKILFGEEEIQKYGLDQDSFLNKNIFKRDIECICAYSFIHLSFQEFFAALSYVLEEGAVLFPPERNRSMETLLETYKTSRRDLALTVHFLFGLLNEEQRMREFKETFGLRISPKIKELLLQWVKSMTGTKIVCRYRSKPQVFGLLYENQEVDFVKRSLDHVTEVKFYTSGFTEMDIVSLSFCLKNCHNLEVLNLKHEEYYTCMFLSQMLFEAAARNDNEEDHKREEEGELLGRLQLHQEAAKREPVQHFCEAVIHGCSKLREIRLSGFNLTAGCCKELSRVLITNQALVILHISSVSLGDSGTKRLCEALRHPECKVQSLTLKHCKITSTSCGDLSSVFCTNQNLRELQLDGNKLGDAGLKFLCKGLKHPKCRIKSRGFVNCNLTAACCEDLSSVLCTKQSQGELDLSTNDLGDRGIKLLCEVLKNPKCYLQKLRLSGCGLSETCGEDLTSVLNTNRTLTDLELSNNRLGDFWLRLLCEGLKHPNCRLQKLGLNNCSITVDSCWHFSSVLRTNQHLRELELDGNYLTDAGLTFLCKGLKDPNCHLKSIGFANCNLTAACCEDLSSVLCSNQSLAELDFSGNRIGKRGMKVLCRALEHPNCHLQKLRLSYCGLKESSCEDLSSVLSINQTLSDLDLEWNKLGNSGLGLLCKGLKHPNCRLQKLGLSGCSLTGSCCGDLASLLSSNQKLTDLNLHGLEMGGKEARLLREGLEHPNCKLQKLVCNWEKLKKAFLTTHGWKDPAMNLLVSEEFNSLPSTDKYRELDHAWQTSMKKYREHIRKKYQPPEDEDFCLGVHVPVSECYTKLIKANEEVGADKFLKWRWRHRGMEPEQTVAASIDTLFGTDSSMAETVVLLGVAGVGKTTMARKILLDWASGRLFPERFDSVFYINCRQLDLLKGQVSLADLILKNHLELTPKEAIKELLMNPNKLLFIMDGLDELNISIEQQKDNLNIDPCERNPVSVLLSGLITKSIFPEACLLITTRPSALGTLENCLRSPCFVGLLGFTLKGREEYFHQFFGDQELAAQALEYIKRNEALLAMSFVPGVCWIICTVIKQQLEGNRGDLWQAPDKVTAVYALYLSHLCALPCNSAKCHNLRGLCSLAAEGIWKKRVWFKAEEIQKQGLALFDSLPSAWWENLFQRDPDSDDIYSFVHLNVQEFLTALFYVFDDAAKDLETTKQETKVLLKSCSKDRGDLSLIVLFMFGLLNGEIMKYVQEQFGWKMSSTIQGDLLEWLKGYTEINSDYPCYDQLEHFHSLYEMQEEEFAQHALSHLTELTLDRLKLTPLDQAALSFCVKHCLNLETLSLYTCSFLLKNFEEGELLALPTKSCQLYQRTQKHSEIDVLCQALMGPNSKIKKLELDGSKLPGDCAADLSSVLSSNQMLVELSLHMTSLGDSGLRLLGEGLSHPNCMLEKLGLWDCDLTSACCSDLCLILRTSQRLTELRLASNSSLGEEGVQLLCEGLKHPSCQLQSLGLEDHTLIAAGCQDLASVLATSQTLKKLNLEHNKLGDAGVKLLCEGLKHPDCRLQTLVLGTCELTAACCEDLASVLRVNPTLTELTLDYNVLEDLGVQLLYEGLKQPNCQLQILGLEHCSLTAACCGALSSVLATSQSLKEMDLDYNMLGDAGVKLLCEGLKHPHCRLQKLNLYNCDLSAVSCEDLASVLSNNGMMSELLLGSNKLGELGMKLLCEGLKHPHCKLQKLCLCGSEITPGACEELSSAFRMSPMLEDIDFWGNPLGDAGVRLLCEGLKDPGCKLQVLGMWNCKLTAASCEYLCSAVSTSQNLKELQLKGNELGDAGVQMLCKGLRHPCCKLRKIGLDTEMLMEESIEELVSLKRIKPDFIIDT